jgi:hypothetical protein
MEEDLRKLLLTVALAGLMIGSAHAMPVDCRADSESEMEACMQRQVNAGYCKHIGSDEAHSFWIKGKANRTKGNFGACEAQVLRADPSQTVQQALLPLLQRKKGADQNETRFFSSAFKKLADEYFSVDDNARDFDADWLLGMQDWGGLTPEFFTTVLDDSHAKVKVSFKQQSGDVQSYNVYTVVFDGKNWTIDDIAYSDGKSLRDTISHAAWCKVNKCTD